MHWSVRYLRGAYSRTTRMPLGRKMKIRTILVARCIWRSIKSQIGIISTRKSPATVTETVAVEKTAVFILRVAVTFGFH